MLLDSNILIYAATTQGAFLRPLVRNPAARLARVSRIEVMGYHRWEFMPDEARVLLETMIGNLPEIPLHRAVANRAIDLRRQRNMKLGDAIIAATALVHRLPLVTRNSEDFRHVESLQLVNPFAAGEAPPDPTPG